jgi:protein-S-isoprenylcysteine O-methyltransferase Ste14
MTTPVARAFRALRAALYASVFIFGWGLLALAVRPWDASLGGPLPSWLPAVGIMLLIVGAGLALACVVLFVSHGRGTPAPFDAPREFVAAGPYRWTRNPMYVGGFGMLLGLAFVLRSPSVLLLVAAAVAVIQLFVVAYEEPTLRRKFGPTYEDYTRRVNRWLPRRPQGR